MMLSVALAIVAAQAAPPAPMAGMDHAPAACAATTPPPPGLAGWSRMAPAVAGAGAGRLPALAIGTGVRATLSPTPRVRYPVPPEKPGDTAGHGGLFAFVVTDAGRYRVALGSGAWIDVVRDGAAIASVAHAHGPDCSGVRKMVDFALTPGRYLLQIAGNAAPMLPLMIARLP